MRRLLGYVSNYRIKCLVFFLHLLYGITKNFKYAKKSNLYTTFEAEIIILEINFYNGGETTRGRTGKREKRLRGERESGRNDPGAKLLGAIGKVENDPDSSEE